MGAVLTYRRPKTTARRCFGGVFGHFQAKQGEVFQQWAGKVMASVFWDGKGIIYIDYLKKGKTINGEYYIALLVRLKTNVAKKRPHMARKKMPFH